MTNKQHPKVRLVKCPRCARILPEPEHVPLYSCGGCGTTLQAKNYRSYRKDAAFNSPELDAVRSNGIIHACDSGESRGSSRRSSSSGEKLSIQEKGRDQDAVPKSFNSVQNGDANSSDHISLSKESSILKKNGLIDSKMDQCVLKDQKERRDREAVPSCSYSEQNGAANSVNRTAFSQESSFIENKENEEIDSKCDKIVLKVQNKGKDWDAVKKVSKFEQSGSGNYVHHTALSESSFTENKENGVIDDEMDKFDSKDHCAYDYPTVLGNKEPEQLTMESSVMEDDNGQDERCNGNVVENHHEKQIGDVNHDREMFILEDPQVLRKKECQQPAVVRQSMADEDDQHEQNQVGFVNSAKDASSLTELSAIKNTAEYYVPDHQMSEETRKLHLVGKYSHQNERKQEQIEYVISSKDTSLIEPLAIKNPAEHDASEHDVSEETRTMHVVGEHPHQDQHEQKQVGYVNSSKDASSLTEFPAFKKPTQLGSENSAEYDPSDHEVSEEIREAYHVGKHSHPDVSGNEIKCSHEDISRNEIKRLDGEKPQVEKSGNEYGSGGCVTGPYDFVECIAKRLGSVTISSATSLSTEINHGGNDDLLSGTEDNLEACENHSVSARSNATDLKVSHEEGTTKVFRDPHYERNSLDYVKGISKKITSNLKDSAVCIDSVVGSLPKEIPRSPKKRSPAYDGSVSSFDGNDDQVPRKPVQFSEETLSTNNAAAGYDGAEESPDWNIIPSERIIYRNPRVQTEKLKSRMIKEKGPLEENGIPLGNNRYRPDRDSFLPRVPNHRKSSEMAFETGSSSSNPLHDVPPSHPMHHHPYRRRVPEVPPYREKDFFPLYYDYESSGEIYDRPKYHHAYFDRRRRAGSWSQSGTLPRMPYSGEILNGRSSYMHRYPEDRRWSAQLPPPAVCCHQGAYMGPPWENRWDPYDSYPTSPQRFVESESSYAWGHDTISLSDDPRQKDQFMRRMYLREKRQAVKRKFHPIAGGAPFLTCNFCFNVLQLPEGFLLSRRRRSHKLQCGACSRILEFSLETNVDKNVNLPMPSHVNHSHRSSLNSADGREFLSRDSFGASCREKRKFIPGSSRNGETMEGLLDAAPHAARGRESKVTWKMPARSKSPLHRLMGYSSPKDLLTGHEESEDEDLE